MKKGDQMWSAIASFLLGVVGWLVTSFFAKPLLDFLNLRTQVHEEIVFTSNVGHVIAGTPDSNEAVAMLRRLGARVEATNVTASVVLRWFLSNVGFDLANAASGLIGLSNSLANEDGGRAVHKNSIQVGLRLPRDYDDERMRGIEARIRHPNA